MEKEFSEFISEVLDKTDIVNLISRYVKVEKKGGKYWACCPFHNETEPSFNISDSKQLYHCFGCKKSGNAISFLMELENIEFIDALKILAEQAGLEMPQRGGGDYVKRISKDERETLYRLMRDAALHYHANLSQPSAKRFTDYLEKRQIPTAMVKQFGLGASLDFTDMIDYLKSKGYSYEQIHAAGIAESKDGRQYDVFGNRLIFPIIDNMNHVVAFGGRTLEKDTHFAKYRNSAQTDIFDKSKIIYGVNMLKKRKAVGNIDYIIMTEGYMDVIALHKAGFTTAVASMGTALTSKQARQLKIYSDNVFISYDGDTAGQKATLRGLDILRECGLTVKVVRLPDGLDPDDVIKHGGSEEYSKLLENAIPLTAHKLEVIASRYDLSDPDFRAQYAIECMRAVAELQNPIEREQYTSYISQKTGFTTEALQRQVALAQAAPQDRPRTDNYREPEPPASVAEYDSNLIFFLSSIVTGKDYIDFDRDVTQAMPDDATRKIYEFCRDNRMKNTAALLVTVFNPQEYPIIERLLDYRMLPGDGRARFTDIQMEYYRRILKAEMNKLSYLIKSDPLNKDRYTRQLSAKNKELGSLPKYHA